MKKGARHASASWEGRGFYTLQSVLAPILAATIQIARLEGSTLCHPHASGTVIQNLSSAQNRVEWKGDLML